MRKTVTKLVRASTRSQSMAMWNRQLAEVKKGILRILLEHSHVRERLREAG